MSILHLFPNGNFNPRTRVGCDQVLDMDIDAEIISIHAPGWGATRGKPLNFAVCMYFNPRTRVGCDFACTAYNFAGGISIHAPGWGATYMCFLRYPQSFISIHAPGWGATLSLR